MQFKNKHNLIANTTFYAISILVFNLTANAKGENVYWNQFRGPNGQGVAKSSMESSNSSRTLIARHLEKPYLSYRN
jgi:hypothetical protein